MRKEYTYILTIGNKVVKPVAVGWWSTEEDMVTTRCGMATAARAFRKTAGILVYEKEKDSDLWVFCDDCDIDSRLFIPAKIETSGMNITKKLYRDYSKNGEAYMEGDF